MAAADDLARQAGFPPPWPMPVLPSLLTKTWCCRLAREHEVLITVEEGSIGGFATQVMQFLDFETACLDHGLKFRPL